MQRTHTLPFQGDLYFVISHNKLFYTFFLHFIILLCTSLNKGQGDKLRLSDWLQIKSSFSWDLGEINNQLHRLSSIFNIVYEIAKPKQCFPANYTKSVVVTLDEQRYCELMANLARFCDFK